MEQTIEPDQNHENHAHKNPQQSSKNDQITQNPKRYQSFTR